MADKPKAGSPLRESWNDGKESAERDLEGEYFSSQLLRAALQKVVYWDSYVNRVREELQKEEEICRIM